MRAGDLVGGTEDPDTEITCEELENLWLLYLKRVRKYALLSGKLQLCSAGEEQEDQDVCHSVYVTAVGVDMLLVKAPVLVFVAVCISVLYVCVIVYVCLMSGKHIALAAAWTYQWEHQPQHV